MANRSDYRLQPCAYCGQYIEGEPAIVCKTVMRRLPENERRYRSKVAGRHIDTVGTAHMKMVHPGACEQWWNRTSREEWIGVA